MIKKRGSFVSFLLIICMMTVVMPIQDIVAYAASKKTISKVTIDLKLDLEAGDSLPDLSAGPKGSGCTVEASSDRYVATEAQWVSSTSKDVKIGTTYTLKVTLEAETPDEYIFQGTYKDSNVTVKGGTFVGASKKNSSTLVVTIKTKPVKGELETPEDAYWKSSPLGTAEWKKVNNVDTYEVSLYKGSSSIYKIKAYKGTRVNFYPYMTSAGTYSYKVRAIASNDALKDYAESSEWIESDELYIAKESVSNGSGKIDYNINNGNTGSPDGSGSNAMGQVGWIQSGSRWCYRYPDGSYQKGSWLAVNGKWYLFDQEGWMLTGWQENKGYWYYLDGSGAMRTGWIQASNGWYFLNMGPEATAGIMWRSQWLDWNNKRYYLTDTGVMAEGWKEIDGKWYYFNPGEGSMVANTTIGTFTLGADGAWIR